MAEKNPWKVATIVLALLFIISFFVSKDLLRPWEQPADTTPMEPDTSADPPVTLVLVNDPDCIVCDTADIETRLKTHFPTLTIRHIDAFSTAGKKLISRYNLVLLPSLLFDDSIILTANYEKIKPGLEPKTRAYLVRTVVTGSGRLLLPPKAVPDDAAKGSTDAPVTIFTFSDFECPFCKKFFDSVYPQLTKEYIDTGKVRFIFRQLPLEFHEYAIGAALASLCAHEQGKFWEYHDLLYTHQNALASDNIQEYAQQIDLDMRQFADCYNTLKYAKRVSEDTLYAASIGIGGTPTFIINDLFIAGVQPHEVFKGIIDSELERVKQQ